MIDSEDIIDSVTNYLTEIVGVKSRINNAIDLVNSEKGDTLLPNVVDDVVLGQRLQEMDTCKNGRLNLDIVGETKFKTNYNSVAKYYIIELSYIIQEDFTSTIFKRALRMERVFTDVMKDYFENSQVAGFISGDIGSSFTPERVLLGNSGYKAIKSGVVYNFILN